MPPFRFLKDDDDGGDDNPCPSCGNDIPIGVENCPTCNRPADDIADGSPTKVNLYDTFAIDSVRRTSDGYLTCNPRVAKVGIQVYKGRELGRPDLGDVKVYRPAQEVFHKDAMHSMAHRPVTLEHPPEAVSDSNWRRYAVGHTGDEVVRDGDAIRVPMVVMDRAAIDAYENGGKRELSVGYSTDIKWKKGVTKDGEPYDAIQTQIRGNHLAMVDAARGGPTLRMGDATLYDKDFTQEEREKLAKTGAAMPGGSFPIRNEEDLKNAIREVGRAKNPAAAKAHIIERAKSLGAESKLPGDWTTDADVFGRKQEGDKTMTAIVTIDGARIEVADALSANVIEKHVSGLHGMAADLKGKLDKANADKEAADEKATRAEDAAKKTVDAKDGEIAALKKQLEDSKKLTTPEVLDGLVKARLAVVDRAAKVLEKTFAYDGKSIEDIRRAAVVKVYGDAFVKDRSDEYVAAAFDALTLDVKSASGIGALRDALSRPGIRDGSSDPREAALADRAKFLADAWKGPQRQQSA